MQMNPFSVEASIDAYVESVETPREPDGLWHPSSISSPCDRKSIYEINGYPKEPIPARTKRVFRVGHILHQFVQDAIAADPTVEAFWPEVGIKAPALGITGHADGLLRFKDGSYEVLEFKTISSRAFKYGDLPKPDHIIQVSLYMKILREHGGTADDGWFDPLGDLLPRARIVYVSKDDLLIGEYKVLWTDARNQEILDKLATLNGHRDAGTLPERLPMTGSKRHYLCGYCPFQTLCWE
jgi:hypothetical protein